jgi:exosortase D (VPLPA-CTERM-specific)
MNSLRIAITGLLVKSYGNEVAEGFLHDFEGWVVFLAAFICLMAEVWVFTVLVQRGKSIYELFDFDGPSSSGATITTCLGNKLYFSSLITVVLLGGSSIVFAFSNTIVIPERKSFSEFPMRVDGRNVSLYSFEQDVIDILKPDDYFVGNYLSRQEQPVGLYMVYYSQQKDGSALHSPKVCIPGGGWIVEDTSIISFPVQGSTLSVNRVLIRKGERKQLVYYWINQMGVNYTNEYFARVSLIKSAILNKRSDGALIRVNMVVDGDNLAEADEMLQSFVHAASMHLSEYLPAQEMTSQ